MFTKASGAEEPTAKNQNEELITDHASCARQHRRLNRTPHGFKIDDMKRGLMSRNICSNPSVITRGQCRYLFNSSGMKYCEFGQDEKQN